MFRDGNGGYDELCYTGTRVYFLTKKSPMGINVANYTSECHPYKRCVGVASCRRHAHLLHDIILSLGASLPLALCLCTGGTFDPHVLQLSLQDGEDLSQRRGQPARCSGWRAAAQQGDERVMHDQAHCSRFLVLQTV